MNTYPWDVSPEQMTAVTADRGFSFELRGGAFLSVEEALWLKARHEWLDRVEGKTI